MSRFTRIGLTMFVIIVGGLSLLPYLLSDGATGEMPEPPFAESRVTEIAGQRLHYRSWEPDGEPVGAVLLVHGMAGSSFSWRETTDALVAAGYRVVTPDLPPFGYSEKRAPADAGTSYQELLTGLLTEVSSPEQEWVLVGHSMGASAIATLAAAGEISVAGMVFVGGTHDTADARGEQNPISRTVMAYPPVQRWIATVAGRRMLNEEGLGRALESAYGREPDEDEVEGYLEPLQIAGTPHAFVRKMLQPETVAPDTTGESPGLVIWGEADEWVPVSSGRRLAEARPHTRMEIIDEAGHSPMETHPEEFNTLLLDFLRERTED